MSEPTPAPTPSRAVYGFAWFLFFKTFFILYIFWAFVPEHILEETFGLTYLPNKYFALCIPVTVVSAVMYAFFIYPLSNLAMQDDINDPHTIHDNRTIKRCSFVDRNNGKRCARKVNRNETNASSQYNVWISEEYCDEHCLVGNGIDGNHDNSTENGCCDCINKNNCLLEKNANHLHTLHNRSTVPSMFDLDISTVSRQLYLDE